MFKPQLILKTAVLSAIIFFTCFVSIKAQSEVEPNDTFGNANPITFAGIPANGTPITRTGAITPANDLDKYVLSGGTPGILYPVVIETFDGSDSTCGIGVDTIINVYNASGVLVKSNDDDGIRLCSYLYTQVGPNYYIEIRGFLSNLVPAYTFKISNPQEVEQNGTLALANNIPTNPNVVNSDSQVKSLIATTNSVGDNDVYKFTINTPQRVSVETFDPFSNTCNPQLRVGISIRNSTDIPFASASSNNPNPCATILNLALNPGVYYIQENPLNSAGSDPTLPYRLRLTVDGVQNGLEREPNNNTNDAYFNPTQINSSVSITGAISPVGDVDVFIVNLSTANRVKFQTFDTTGVSCTPPANGTIDTALRLLDSNGVQIAFNDDSGGTVCSLIDTNLAAGTYYIQVQHYNNSATISGYFLKTTIGSTKYVDFDGDGKTDISIFRPSNGEWYYQRSSNSAVNGAAFGGSSDKPVPADYTGDGKTDVAFFRPSSGQWFILRSEDSSFFAFPFGVSTDIVAPGDFDGDGKADQAVFRPSNGVWYINKSTGGVTIQPFGTNNDRPVVADYDGDGKSDIAIFRPSVGEWYTLRSSDSQVRGAQFGSLTDKTVQGDYTGDGKADFAFFRPSTGSWFVLRSEDSSFFASPFGVATDIPTIGDYDGDAKFDQAVFRPSNGVWYVNRSTAGVQIQQFGVGTDLPVPSYYLP